MRVLQIANGYFDSKLYGLLFDALQEKGAQQTVFVPVRADFAQSAEREGVHVVPCFTNLDRVLFYRKQNKMLRWLEQNLELETYDVCHAHTVFSGGFSAWRLYQRYGIPYIVAVRNTDVNVFFKYMVHLRKVGIQILRDARQVIFLSPAYEKQLMGRYVPEAYREELRRKSQVIPNGISQLFLQNQPQAGTAAREPVGLIYVGNINTNKNLETTIAAAQLLRRRGKEVTVTAVGAIQEEKYRKLLEETAFARHYDRAPQQEVLEHLRKADIFVMPSHTETFGLVYAEAMSQGLPVLYTAGQGFDGQFSEGTVGYRVSDRDPQTIADGVEQIVKDYGRISQNCVRLAGEFDWDRIANRYGEIYRRIAAGRKMEPEDGD